MDATERLLLIAVAWGTIGVAAAILMGRRGHNSFAWLILGAALGPLCIPVAMVAVFEERTHVKREVVDGRAGQGPVDILVGIDGSRESEAALRRTGALFGTHIGRLTLASVEDFDTAGSGDPLMSEDRTALRLERVASEFGAQRPSAIILSGRPAEALIRYATDEGFELIAIGRRGRGASKAVMGAQHLGWLAEPMCLSSSSSSRGSGHATSRSADPSAGLVTGGATVMRPLSGRLEASPRENRGAGADGPERLRPFASVQTPPADPVSRKEELPTNVGRPRSWRGGNRDETDLDHGAAGRDFHNFNTVFRKDVEAEVVAFTATQIPFISDRMYPAALAGPRYPRGIPIRDESELSELIRKLDVDEVVFSYSDVSHEYVMHKASEVLAAGANFMLLGPETTMLEARVPVVAVCAVRTGAGKSQTTRRAAQFLRRAGLRPVVVRHPMPYGDLVAERVQRFASTDDLDAAGVTVEEREEYEHHIANGTVVYAGVDYQAILEQAESEADVVLWDGGNNDLPFFRPTIHIVVADPLRAGDETTYHPGEANLRMADVIVINKVDVATSEQVARVEASIRDLNADAMVIRAESPVTVDRPELLAGARALVIEDGPTLTHGGMKFGAGVVAAKAAGAEIVDPRPYAVGTIKRVLERYDVGPVIPAQGYGPQQIADMEATITTTDADVVVIATPIDLRHLIRIAKPAVRVTYELQEVEGSPTLADALTPLTSLSRR